MELWREKIKRDLEAFGQRAENHVAVLSISIKHNLPSFDCVQCHQKTFRGDGLALACGARHFHCYDCISDCLEHQRGLFERFGGRRSGEDLLDEYPALRHIALCSTCHFPAVVREEEVFQVLLQGKEGTSKRKVYTIDQAMTGRLSAGANASTDNFFVEVCFENERRCVGKFSNLNLLSWERPRFSNDAGEPVDKARVDDLRHLPHGSADDWLWLEPWKPDTQNNPCDTQGWQYARSWPDDKGAVVWFGAPTWRTFIRRRKLMRTRVKLTALHGWTPPARDRCESEARSPPTGNGAANSTDSSSGGGGGRLDSTRLTPERGQDAAPEQTTV